MDNGAEVVAKIPNSNADYTTAILGVPVPAILDWSSQTTNEAGSEYIIMEKAEGQLLSGVWYQLGRDGKSAIIQQLVDLQVLLASKPFTAHGCLFYQGDISLNMSCPREVPGDLNRRFTLGPLALPALWEDGRRLSISDYATAVGENEQAWVSRNAAPRMNYFRDSDTPETPAEMLDLLDKYLTVAPHITKCAGSLACFETSILSHPDIRLGNLFIDPRTNKITSIIDWQGAAFTPLVLQAKIPRMIRHPKFLKPGLVVPERPGNYEYLDAAAKQDVDRLHESALYQKYHEVLVAKKHPQLYAAIIHNVSLQISVIEPLQVVCGCWKDREVYKLRSSLMRIADNWNMLGTSLHSCPIGFPEEEVRRHDQELENIDHVESIMEAFQGEGILPSDGRVDPEDYEILEEVNRVQKTRYMSLATNEDEAIIMEKTWPWQDWPERLENNETSVALQTSVRRCGSVQ
ncbi:hypothetical protein LTR70_010042 [Exophiala xenobiotica]|uniref:Altered inheritance of mitochondria protein 9, mitochondrial n=1 Tax=Lithohypha guttulata TaxID=1690604 RepID=A0ABR0JW60_9EURO|nr:hypothetical protein LTR24_009935 [Lithohypha guttulata]KAK5309730.1 hypothetical protein LTR70_010042 [Exophiala xenobiotica]